MVEREQIRPRKRKAEPPQQEEVKADTREEVKAKADELLEEIDEVINEALRHEELVHYKQAGGE